MLWFPRLQPAGWAVALARWLARTPIDNRWLIGRLVEIGGNQVTVNGLTFALDNPLIRTRDKTAVCLGLHEAPELALVQTRLIAALPVIEFGGGIGIVSCHINRRLAQPRDHIVVEANPDLIPTLETNRRLNGSQFRIHTAALAYGVETIELAIDSWVTSRVGGSGIRRTVVPATTLAKLLQESGFAHINLVVDIEGAEAELVESEAELLSQRVRTLILESHPSVIGADRTARMIATIRTLGFTETARFRQVLAFENPTLAL